ncbi:ankyrin repeat domain-containing protein [Candidatus Babeliales bacterium]|nr:ankyrin repeat domain-containing protein [Candidatus Babeliales bacterium]MBP9843792.1 ankyrin repeat domain-containing protein [Candidatus Babeliales bacterium]
MKFKILLVMILSQVLSIHAGPLHDAVRNKDLSALIALLNESPDLEEVEEIACTERDINLYQQLYKPFSNDFMKRMIEAKSKQYEVCQSKKTALHLAAEFNFVEGLELLIKAGADIYSTDIFYRIPLACAVQYNSIEVVKFLLKTTSITPGTSYNALLFYAAANNYPQMALLLIEAGAQVNELSFCQGKGGFNIFTGQVYGTRPLHTAVLYNSYEVVGVLLQSGANKYLKNKKFKTAFELAQNDRMHKILKHIGTIRKKN